MMIQPSIETPYRRDCRGIHNRDIGGSRVAEYLSEGLLVACIAFALFGCEGGSGSGLANALPDVKGVEDKFVGPRGLETVNLRSGRSVFAVKDEVLVSCAPDLTSAEILRIEDRIRQLGGRVVAYSNELNVYQVRLSASQNEENFIDSIRRTDGVMTAFLNEIIPFAESVDGNSGGMSESAYIQKFDGFESYFNPQQKEYLLKGRAASGSLGGAYWINQISLEDAWLEAAEYTAGTKGLIGIVDTGLSLQYVKSIMDEKRVSILEPFGPDIGLTEDGNSNHGLTVTAFAAGWIPGDGKNSVSGVDRWSNVIYAPRELQFGILDSCSFGISNCVCRIIPQIPFIKCDYHRGVDAVINMSLSTIMNSTVGVIQAGAKVVNNSYGYRYCKSAISEHDILLIKQTQREKLSPLLMYAQNNDVLMVFSSGNSCFKGDNQFFSSSYSDERLQEYWLSNALIVGASNKDKKDADFSDMGYTVDLVAPGEEVSYHTANPSATLTHVGTSFSAPIVSGLAGIVRGINPGLRAPEVKSILKESSQKITFSEIPYADRTQKIAETPDREVNAKSAVRSAVLTRGVALTRLSSLKSHKGLPANFTVDVSVPLKVPLDIVFLVDQSASFSPFIDDMKRLIDSVVGEIEKQYNDVQVGLAGYSDFPISPYGVADDSAYIFHQALTKNRSLFRSVLGSLTVYDGADEAEAGLEAIYQVVTGKGKDLNGDGDLTDAGEIPKSSMGWRAGSAKIVVIATDAGFHTPTLDKMYPGPSVTEVVTELSDSRTAVYGIWANSAAPVPTELNSVAAVTQLLATSSGKNISTAIVDAIRKGHSKVDVSLQRLNLDNWNVTISPKISTVAPGSTARFSVSLESPWKRTESESSQSLYLWAKTGGALVQRIEIPITIPKM